MAKRFGIDFGTTNSVASIILHLHDTNSEKIAVLTNREDQRPHPSVIWYKGAETIVGRDAKNALGELVTGTTGDFVRSPKTLLASPHRISVGGIHRKPMDLASEIFSFIKNDALNRGYQGERFDSAVVSVPVNMKGHTRRELRQAAQKAGINIYQFVHEPLAALYGYLRGNHTGESNLATLEGEMLLVFDWGGGTLDLTLCKVSEGTLVQIANLGDAQIGGDQFDKRLVQLVRDRHESKYSNVDWSMIQPSGQARLIQACEDAKIALSDRSKTLVFAPDILAIQDDAAHVEVEITREDLYAETRDLIGRGLRRIEEILSKADATDKDIAFCLATGGTMATPSIREGLIEIFGPSRCRFTNNAATVISEGCAWIAHDGVKLSTAKSLSILHAGDVFIPTIPCGTLLPTYGELIQDKFSFYCVDPRDGFAKFLLGRSRWPDDVGDMIPYGQLAVYVDPNTKPLRERLELTLCIDQDLVATVTAKSEGAGFERQMEIHDMEFGLCINPGPNSSSPKAARITGDKGDIRIKANITDEESLSHVPGELVQEAFPLYTELTDLQKDELDYYLPCCRCGRNIYEILRDGCDECAASQPNLSKKQTALRQHLYNTASAPETWTTESADQVGNIAAENESKTADTIHVEDIDKKVETLGFSVRVTNCMKMHGVQSVGDLVNTRKSEVSSWRSLGRSGLREIETRLEGLGLSLLD